MSNLMMSNSLKEGVQLECQCSSEVRVDSCAFSLSGEIQKSLFVSVMGKIDENNSASIHVMKQTYLRFLGSLCLVL